MHTCSTRITEQLCKKSIVDTQPGHASNRKPLPTKHRGHSPTLYDESYADAYESFYLHPWEKKHQLNVDNILSILTTLSTGQRRWLDLCCGQAWHFSMIKDGVDNGLDDRIEKVGVDLSPAQLKRAALRNPTANFILADVLDVSLPQDKFGLVTSFWAAYCYLNSRDKIEIFLRRAIDWTNIGGTFYLEVLTGEDLMSFNRSPYAHQTGFQVIPRTPDFREWDFSDVGGQHHMTSPPIDFFVDIVSPFFSTVEIKHDSGFMIHLVCIGRTERR